MKRPVIVGVGKCLPGEPISNAYLIKALDLPAKITEQFVEEKIGIKYRHLTRKLPSIEEVQNPQYDASKVDWESMWGCKEGFACSDLAAEAIKNAAKQAGIELSQLDMIILSTVTPDLPCPPTSTIVADKLGINNVLTTDIRSACSGSTQTLYYAQNCIRAGQAKYIACVGIETGSNFGLLSQSNPAFTFGDAVNGVLIGDAASAFIVKAFEPNEEITKGLEIVDITVACMGQGKKPGMWYPGGGCVSPMSFQHVNGGQHHFLHDTAHVIKNGPVLYMTALNNIFDRNKITLADIDLIIPHQANGQVKNIAKGLGVDPEKIFMNIENVGNTGNASLGLCICDIVDDRNYNKNSLLLMLAAESTKWLYGGTLLKWHGSLTGKDQQGVKQETGYLDKQKSKFRIWVLNKILGFKSGAKL